VLCELGARRSSSLPGTKALRALARARYLVHAKVALINQFALGA
jgi:hypothetical protein